MKQTLFYPCCARDLQESVKAWQHIIDDYWFAEINFNDVRKSKADEMRDVINWQVPILRFPHLELVSQNETTLTGDSGEIVPVKSFTYFNKTLEKSMTMNFAGGCAVDVFNCLPTDKFSVFVNRGDHRVDGEGSSGICWLDDEGSSPYPNGMLKSVLSKLDVGSFIVTDGSNAIDALNPYSKKQDVPFANFHHTVNPVTLHGVRLRCIGMLKPQYGPTLVWQVVGQQVGF